MKMEKETNEPLKSTETIKQSALEEFLEEWGSWRGKKKAAKVERDSHIVQPRGKRRTKNTEFMDSAFMVVIQFFVMIVEFIMTAVSWIFTHLFSWKFIMIIAAIVYYFDFDFKMMALKAVGENSEEIIQHLEEGTDAFNKQLEGKKEAVKAIMEENATTLDSIKEQLKGIQINIKKADGTEHKFDTDDIDEWFTIETKEPEKVPFTQTPLKE